MEFDFTIPEHSSLNFLQPDDLRFFYYDVEHAYIGGIYDNDSWNKVMDGFQDKVDISPCECKDLPSKVNLNTIKFSVIPDTSVTSNFFRHMRNAFMHHRVNLDYSNNNIIHLSDAYYDNKEKKEKITMIGKIESGILKEICFKFLEINDQAIDSYKESTDTE